MSCTLTGRGSCACSRPPSNLYIEGVVGAASEVFFRGLRVDCVHSGACWEAFDLLPRAPATLLSSGLERKAAPYADLRDPLDRSFGMAQSPLA